jgi:hypothetical protein
MTEFGIFCPGLSINMQHPDIFVFILSESLQKGENLWGIGIFPFAEAGLSVWGASVQQR